MIREEDVIKIGKFQKTHALKGELNMILDIDSEYFLDGNPMIIEDDGILVPYYVETIRQKGATSFLVKIDGINSESEANSFVNKDIYILKNDAEEWLEEEILDSHELTGYTIIDTLSGEKLGVIDDIDDSTVNLLFIIKGDDNELIYIPANEDFIAEINDKDKYIRMHLPEGLIELNKKK